MRIAIDYTAALSQGAGIGRYTRSLVRALLAAEGDAYLLFHARSGQRPVLDGLPAAVTTKELPLGERPLLTLWHRLRLPLPLEVFTGPVDVVHGPNFLLPPRRRAAGVVTILDLSFLLYPECADRGLVAFLERAVPASVAAADLVVAISEQTKRDLVCLLDVEPDRVEVVPLGVEPHFRPVEDAAALAALRARLGVVEPFILSVGTLEPRKNLTTLLEAFALLRRRGCTHRLVLAGRPGWLCEEVFRTAERLSLGDAVVFAGYVAEADLPALYSAADAFAYPSLYEGFGLPPLESLACGTPAVCSDASSLPEVVGDAALLVPPTDAAALAEALERVLGDAALRSDLRARGLARAAEFTWARCAARMRAIYHRLAPG
ncbi:MAG: glycosyltransferase family 4 protein [Chloroflexi bacterium]|nr:glycosyltransferase family 4 protein [Chloroflexota bacterium]